jgi:hypothetical protein
MTGWKLVADNSAGDLPDEFTQASARGEDIRRVRGRKTGAPGLVFAAKLGLGLALLAALFWHYNLASNIHLISGERPDFFIASVALFIGGQVMSAYRWQLLARLNGIAGPFREYAAYYFIGMFTNLFVPGLIGGDALRALYLGRRHGRIAEAIASVIADRGVGLMALFWFAAIAAVCITQVRLAPSVMRATIAIGVVTAIAYCCAPIAARFTQFIGGRVERLTAPLTAYLRRPSALIPAILLSLVLQFSLAVCQYLLAVGLNLSISLTTFLLVVPIANVVASLPVTINGLGMREASYLLLLGIAGVGKEPALALSLLYFAATLTGGITGLIPFIRTPMPQVDPRPHSTSSQHTAMISN